MLCNWLYGYNHGDPQRNGEYRFLNTYLKNGMIFFDVGANVGNFTQHVLSIVPESKIHCFEPTPDTFEKLLDNCKSDPGVSLNNVGLSDESGTAKIKVYGKASEINSLHIRRSLMIRQKDYMDFTEQTIQLGTIDKYVNENAIPQIDLLKIDVEGNELRVLLGAKKSLSSGVIKAIQFEYGPSYVDASASLQEVYELLHGNGFELYRLLPFGKKKIRSFDPVWGLENYQYSNWVAIYCQQR